MRRFWARPCAVSFGATGCVSPKPLADRILALTTCDQKYDPTLPARRDDRSTLFATPARCNAGPTGRLSVNPYTTTLAFCRDLSCGTYWLSAAWPFGLSWLPPAPELAAAVRPAGRKPTEIRNRSKSALQTESQRFPRPLF